MKQFTIEATKTNLIRRTIIAENEEKAITEFKRQEGDAWHPERIITEGTRRVILGRCSVCGALIFEDEEEEALIAPGHMDCPKCAKELRRKADTI